MPSDDRINIVLDEEHRDLADRIAEKLGAAAGKGRSQAIRWALRRGAEELGVAPKKNRPAHRKKSLQGGE